MNETTTMTPLRAADRCDTAGCIARSVVRAHYGKGFVDFCGHHFAKIEGRALVEEAPIEDALGNPTHVQDERDRIRAEEDKREGVG